MYKGLIREPAVAGQFYTSDRVSLSEEIDDYLSEVDVDCTDKDIKGLVAPHAGYSYSGQVAAYGYKQLIGQGKKTAVVFAPSHRSSFKGASVFAGDAYRTPLGDVEVDKELVDELLNVKGFKYHEEADAYEHSLEVQIPFLQKVLGVFKLIPVIIGDQGKDNCDYVVSKIISYIKEKKNIILVASSDLYHGYSYDECVKKDESLLKTVREYDYEALLSGVSYGKFMACGAGPIYIVMRLAKELGSEKSQVLHYANSNDVTGVKGDYVVGYSSVVFY